MKKIFISSFFICLSYCYADEFSISDLSAGMYSFSDANTIPDNAASFLQNVYTDYQKMSVERNGYVKRDTTVLGDTQSVSGLWSFTDISGNEWIISFSSRSFYKNTIGQTPTKFGPTMTTNNVPDAAINLGRIWFTEGINDVWWFDGSSTGAVSSAPKGRLIEPWRTRIVISRVTNTQSTVYFSEDGDGENWTLGGLATDPFTREIGGANDGQYIRCMANYYDSLIIGRKIDLWTIDGFDQNDADTRQISDQIGCLEPGTMKVNDNELDWLSNRGIEEMSGRTITNISEPIRNITDQIVKNSISQRTNIQSTQADWSNGSFDTTVYVDTQTSSGDLQPIFPDLFDSFRDGTINTKNVWTEYESGTVAGDINVSDGKLILQHDGGTLGRINVYTTNQVENFQIGTTYYVQVTSMSFDSGNLSDFYWTIRPTLASSPSNPDNSGVAIMDFESTTSAKIKLTNLSISGQTGPSSSTTSFNIPATISFYFSTNTYNLQINSVIVSSGNHTATVGKQYIYLGYLKGSAGSGSLYLDNFGIAPETFTFTSQLLNIGNQITSWGAVTISETDSLNHISYQFGSTTTAAISSISNFASISNGAIPSVSTNPYAGFKSVFASTSPTENLKLSEFITTWSEGSQIPAPIATVYDRRYWISYTTNSASSPYLDRILIYQRNKTWTLFQGINAASFAIWRDNFYFGNSNINGYVYKFDIGENDDGSDISSIIRTKSFDFGQSFRPKEFRKLYLNYLGGGGNFSVSYDIDRYGTNYSLGSINLTGTQGQQASKFPFPLNQLVRGREIQFTIIKSDTSNRLKLYNLIGQFDLKEEE